MKRLFIIFLSLSSTLLVSAGVQVVASIDSMEIFIGQQAHLKIDVKAAKNTRVQFPELTPRNYYTPGVEIIDVSPTDTSKLEDDIVTLTKTITITSFDEKLYPLPGIKVKVDGKQYTANQLALKVITIEVDTLHADQFFPPKDVQDNPFEWAEWSPLFWMSVFVMLMCLACGYLVVRLKQNKPIITHIRIIKKILPHQKALNAIGKLKEDKLNSADDQKEYYTQLTAALRLYIKERFGFNAMEMTSSEILYNLQQSGDREMIDELRALFNTADLVKFAKYSTLLNENDLNLVNAINFIDRTKIEGQPTDERVVNTLSDDEKRTKQNRTVIITLITVTCVAILALLTYVIYNVYLLTV